VKLYVDVDQDGNITDVLSGDFVVPMKEYHLEFDVNETLINELYKYKVVDGVLAERETLPDVGENLQALTPEKEIELLKKENEMNALAIMELAELLLGGA
jgi:hypothetical protein